MKPFKALCLAATLLATGTFAASAEAAAPYAWQTVPWGGGGFVDGFLYHPKQQGLLYARTDIGGMYRYDGQAKSWVPLLDHLGHDDSDLMGVVSFAIDPQDSQKLYAACGLYISQWSRKGAILRSSDQGRTWQKTELPIGVGGNMDGRGTGERLLVDPSDSKTLYFGSNQDGLWRSVDGGATFTKVSQAVKAVSLVAASPSDPHLLYVGSADGKGGLFASRDGGTTLTPVDGGPAQIPQHLAFAADGTVYVAFASNATGAAINPSNASGGSVWKHAPNGKWQEITPVRSGDSNSFGYSGIDVGPDGTIAVSTLDRWWPGDDVFLSKDGGAHWTGLADKSKHDASPYPWLVN